MSSSSPRLDPPHIIFPSVAEDDLELLRRMAGTPAQLVMLWGDARHIYDASCLPDHRPRPQTVIQIPSN